MSSKNKNKNKNRNSNKNKNGFAGESNGFQNAIRYIMGFICSAYVFSLLCIFPLYMEKKYLNMGEAKYHFFKYTSIVFLGVLVVLFITKLIHEVFVLKRNVFTKDAIKKVSVTDWFVVAFIAVTAASFLLAQDKTMAAWGFKGWFMGAVSQLIFVLIFFFVSRYWKWDSVIIGTGLITGAIVYVIAVLQRFDMDIFALYMNLQEDGVTYTKLADKYIEKFVSTLGQTTWYSSYAVLILPFGIFSYYASKKIYSRILSALFIIAGAASLCTVNSDSAYIAVVLILMVYFWFSIKDHKKILQFLEVVLMIIGTFRLIGILQKLFPERMITLISGEEQITNFVNHSNAMLVLLVLVAIVYGVCRYLYHKFYDERMGRCMLDISKLVVLRKVMVYGAIVSVWLVILLIILTTKRKLPDFMGALYNVNFFNFNMDWGNCRGFNWTMALKAISNASFKDLFVGVGPDCFAWAMDKYCYQEVQEYWNGLKLACAHNEWLNMMVTEGILGVTAYLGIFITSFARLGKYAEKEKCAIPCMAAIAAYVGHNIFCYQTCLCTPFIFMIIGIGEMIIMKAKNNEQVSDI